MGDGSTTILVANPDEAVREVVARVVETVGLDAVRLAPDADLADAVVHSGATGAVLDLGPDNLAALEALRARTEPGATGARVVVIGTGPANGRLAWQAGADGFLVRPFHARELQAALTEALARPDADRAAHRDAQAAALV
ncbi:hypothetical protein KSP35_16275 [Aquihabitans sp. G128]|uniref:hypothetical protein n=1 Tax=Aquihabitans sp. G128 TaxID=2849779 RepID=UPI001C2268DD|nr:hypothetical protein [Aquihabitans sp. G128]QXC59920.1 hypothetical protein KSP35_16275 [Aquihabitans sp. G128]